MNEVKWVDSWAASRLTVAGHTAVRSQDLTISQLVAEHPQNARVFDKWGIGYCCDDSNTVLDVACARRGLDVEAVRSDLQWSGHPGLERPVCRPSTHWTQATVEEFIRHIQEVHHPYLRQELNRLSMLIARLCEHHAEVFPELWQLQEIFGEFSGYLEKQVDHEEHVFFPLLNRLGTPTWRTFMGHDGLKRSIREAEIEHRRLHEMLLGLREWAERFIVPEMACNIYRAVLSGLAELEGEIVQYLGEEQETLFPRILAIEAMVKVTD